MKHFCALITGASSGIGEEFAHQLAPDCQNLVLLARSADKLTALKSNLLASFPSLKVHTLTADLTNENTRISAAKQLISADLIPDLLVNNAGMGDYGEFRESDWEKTASMMDLNMMALTHLTHLFLPHMLNQGRGGIINVSSLASTLPIPDFAVYAATKSYVSSFSEALRIELLDHNIPVVALCPGPVHTGFGAMANRKEGSESFGAHELFYVDKTLVVKEALAGLSKNKARVYPGLLVAGAAIAIGLLPLCAVRLMMSARPRRAS